MNQKLEEYRELRRKISKLLAMKVSPRFPKDKPFVAMTIKDIEESLRKINKLESR